MNLHATDLHPSHPSATSQVLDALVVGLGPAGLFTLFQLGLLGLKAEGLDSLTVAGGQCASLYPDKPIYDVPGLPQSSGADLAQQLLQQIQPLGQALHLGRQVTRVAKSPGQGDEPAHWIVLDDQGSTHAARCLVLAAGAGALLPRLPRLEGLAGLQADAHAPRLLTRCPPLTDARLASRQRILILGDEDEALQAAVTLAPGHDVLHLHRRAQFRASEDVAATWRAALAASTFTFQTGMPLAVQSTSHGMTVTWESLTGEVSESPFDLLLPLLGHVPHWQAVEQLGLDVLISGKSLHVDAGSMRVTGRAPAEALPLYAVGDVAEYPGKRKLIVCGFHEATLAAYDMAERLGLRQGPVLFTSSSRVLQARLGALPPDSLHGASLGTRADAAKS